MNFKEAYYSPKTNDMVLDNEYEDDDEYEAEKCCKFCPCSRYWCF